MDLVRSWLGQALRATGAAVVVPVAIIVALSFTAIGGSGLGGLGAFSQLISGPREAGSDLAVDTGDSEIGSAVTQLSASRTTLAARAPGATTPGSVRGNGGGGNPREGGGTPPGGGPGPVDPTPPGGGGPGGGDGPEPPPPAPPPPPPRPPGVVEGVGNAVTDVTAGTPVAPTVEDAVDALVEVCGRLGCP